MGDVNKVVVNGIVKIDLTSDTVDAEHLLAGYTAHRADGTAIVGTYTQDDSDEIDRILTAGLTDGYKHFSDDGTIISTTDSEGRVLTKTFSNDFQTCTTVLTDSKGKELGKTIKEFHDDGLTITTVDSKGQKLVKRFNNSLSICESVLTARDGSELARLNKTFSEDGKIITSVVAYS